MRGVPACLDRLIPVSLLALGTAIALSACDLSGAVEVSPDGVADVMLEIGIDRDLIDDSSLSCGQVMSGALDGYLPVDGPGAQIDDVSDADVLRCRLTEQVSLVDAGWDGQSGAPLWSADAAAGDYRFFVPFSQGTGSEALSEKDLEQAGVDASVTLSVTMPAPVTWASEGEISGSTVTVTGVHALVTDLDIRTGSDVPATGGPATWIVVTVVVAASLLLAAAALILRAVLIRRGKWGRRGKR